MLPECEAAKMRPTGKSFSSKAAFAVIIDLRAQIDDAEARRSDDANAGGRDRSSRSRASRAMPSAPVSAKPSASTVAIFTPSRPHSSTAATAASV